MDRLDKGEYWIDKLIDSVDSYENDSSESSVNNSVDSTVDSQKVNGDKASEDSVYSVHSVYTDSKFEKHTFSSERDRLDETRQKGSVRGVRMWRREVVLKSMLT